MLLRVTVQYIINAWLLCLLLFAPMTMAAECLTVFPEAFNANAPTSEQLINPPSNASTDRLSDNTTLSGGDNFYYNSDLSDGGEVFVGGLSAENPTARLFISTSVSWRNVKINVGGNPQDLIIYTDGPLFINGNDTEINAIIYSPRFALIFGAAQINGAITTAQFILPFGGATVNYDETFINQADFNGMCEGGIEAITLFADYHFDECSYNGAANEVIDHAGGFHGYTRGAFQPASDAILNKSLDLTATDTSDFVALPKESVNGLNNFSIATWFKTSEEKSQQEIFHALGSSTSDDEIELYLIDDDEVRMNVRDAGEEIESNVSLTDGDWHHLVMTRTGRQVCLFVDGDLQDCNNKGKAGAIYVPYDNSVIIGQEQDSYGGSFSSRQSFEGKLDEFKIFDLSLSASQIDNIYQNERSGRNYDGSPRAAVECQSLVGLFKFEQTDFSSQINDTSGLNNHGTNTLGGLSTADGKYCRGFESESWNTGNEITDSFISGVDLDDDVGGQGTISFWFNSTIGWHQGHERTLFDATLNTSFFALEITQDGRLRFAFRDSLTNYFLVEEYSAVNRTANTWYYISVTWDYMNNTFALYLDGNLLTRQTKYTSGQMPDFNNIVFGDNASTYTQPGNAVLPSPYSSRGDYDEVRVYNQVLSQTDIQADMNDSAGCGGVDHFEIDTLDGTGITCQADDIIVRACADADCNTLDSGNFSVELLDDTTSKGTINLVNGVGTTSYTHTSLTDAKLSINNENYQCKNSASTPCHVAFKDSGFIFQSDGNDGIPTQISGKPSNTEFNERRLFLQAVKTDDNSGACTNILPAGTDVPINMSYTCDVGTCGSDLLLENNGSIKNLTTVTSTPTIRFATDSQAEFVITYPDAGRLRLNAQAEIDVIDANGNSEKVVLTGQSNAFVEKPFGFKLDFSQDTNGNNAIAEKPDGTPDPNSSDYFKHAAEPFTVTATAVQWQRGQDLSPFDGTPDDLTVISANDVARNFAGEQLEISHTLLAPNTGFGHLALVDPIEATFNASIASNAYAFDEVGIIQLDAEIVDSNYLGAGNIKGRVNNVGRFVPAYFTQSVESHGTLKANHSTTTPATCDAEDWVYAGQTRKRGVLDVGALAYELEPIIEITPYNRNDAITQNYTEGDFNKLSASDITVTPPSHDDSQARLSPVVAGEKVVVSAIMEVGAEPELGNLQGTLHYTFSENDHFIYEHTKHSKLAPFEANIPFEVDSIQDSDGIELYAGTDPNITATEKLITKGVEIRFARWLIDNSFAPETSSLPLPMLVQQFNGTRFIANTQESCLTPKLTSPPLLTGAIHSGGLALWQYRLFDLDSTDNLHVGDTLASVDGNTFVSGVYRDDGENSAFSLSAPTGSGNKQGSLEIEYEVPNWLKYDWTGDENYTNNPSAIATFGMFRGNDRIIYQREISQ